MFTARKTKSLTKKPKAKKKKKRKQIKILLPAAVLQVAVLPAEAHQVHRLLTVIPKAKIKIKISLFMPMRQYLITNTGAVKIYLMQETIHHQTILTEFLLTRTEK